MKDSLGRIIGTRKLNSRPRIGETRKISLTLPPDTWDWLSTEKNLSARVRDIIEVARASEGHQVDIFEAIKKAQRMGN